MLGTATDRDIVIRGIGSGRSPDAPISQVMSESVMYCYVDDDVDRVAGNMAAARILRLAVLDREEDFVGVVSVGDLEQSADIRIIGTALRETPRPCRNTVGDG